MPYSKQHKAETRARIVEAARRMFNRHGFEAVSIDAIMASANLTRGGFYNHFASKDELYSEAVLSYCGRDPTTCWEGVELDFAAPARQLAMQVVDAYLSRQHLEDLENHCPMIALPSDAARAGPAVRQAYETVLGGMIATFEAGVDARHPERRRIALSMAVLCVGGMVLARTLEDDRLAAEIREAARRLTLEVAGLSAQPAAAD